MAQPDADNLCWDWNPGRQSEQDDTAPSVPARDMTATWSDLAPEPPQPVACSPVGPDLHVPLAAFTIHPYQEPLSIDPDATIGVFHELPPATVNRELPGRAPSPGNGEAVTFPQSGDGIAGFRLISELGRGAFGRVFLAEESLLGNRLVALKITKAEGDEPRILARLQHTHIVPIHSVHDNPQTGLRVMCMPYFGGANLAQVLDAASSSWGHEGDQRSLLRALDIVALPPPSEAIGSPSPRRRSSVNPSSSKPLRRTPTPDPATGHDSKLIGARDASRAETNSVGDGSDDRSEGGGPSVSKWPILSLIPRWSQSIVAVQRSWPRSKATASNDRDPVQPARRFFREANFVRAAAWIIARLAEGLEHAHSHGLMHRDLKPSNILIAADGTPMLLDFNLAADSTRKVGETDRVRMGGTLPYMAPEHLDAFHPNGTTPPDGVDERSDIYALGLILFEMIAGHRPFAEPEPHRPILDVIRTMIDERKVGAPSLRSINPSVPADLDAVVRKCLHPDPERRHARAGDLAEDLRRFLDDQPLKYTAEPNLKGRFNKWLRRNPRATGASTVGLLALSLIIVLSGAAWTVSQHLQVASARLRLKGFEARFPECQFLLNMIGGPAQSLGKGITLAEDTLDQAGITLGATADSASGGWLDALPTSEQAEIRRDLTEVILLLARARVYLADRTHSATEQRKTLQNAIAWLDRAEEINLKPMLTLYDDRANYLAQIGDSRRSALDRQHANSIPPSTGRDYYLMGTALLARNEPDRAEIALRKATELSPQGFWPWFALGLCHYDQQRYTDSATDFAICTVLSPRFAWPWVNRGLALGKDHRLIEARAAYDRALEVDGSMADALANRGIIALELGDVSAAVFDLEQAISRGRCDVNTQATLGEALGGAGRSDEALRLLDGLIARYPDALLPRIARGTIRSALNPVGAEDDFRQILRTDPGQSEALLGLARLKRLTAPRESLELALLSRERNPNRIDTIEHCAWLRGSLGDPEVINDVNRLIQNPTGYRLFNAACSLALYLRHHPDPKLTDLTIDCLRRAIRSGVEVAKIANDPDLAELRSLPAFQALLTHSTPAIPTELP